MNSVVLHPKVWWESVEKNNGKELVTRKKGYERATSKRRPGLFFPRHFMSFKSASLQLRVGTCSSISSFFPPRLLCFCFPYWWLPPKSVRAENMTKTIAFPRSSWLLTVNAGASVISLASGFLCWHISLIRRAMFANLWRAKTRIRFSRESLLFKRIYRVCWIDGFPWNLARTCTDD